MSRLNDAIDSWPAVIQCTFWILISGTLMVVQLGIVRMIANDIDVFEIVFFRALFSCLFIAPLIMSNPTVLLRPNRPVIMGLCGTLAFAAGVFFYFAAKHMPIADITAIHFSRPIFAAILAAIVLKEVIKGARAVAILGGFIGAAIIIRPGMVDFNIGIFFVLGVVCVQTWNPINRRLLSQSEHPDTVAVWTQLIVLPLAMVPAFFFWTTPTLELLGWMAMIGLLEMLNQRVLARAYVQGETVVVLALHYTRLPLAAIVGYLMFGEVAEIWIWVGGAVIACAALYLAQHERRAEMSKAARNP
ncbi:MAG: DMT family transporter [Alphaproteobacteria bacterium]